MQKAADNQILNEVNSQRLTTEKFLIATMTFKGWSRSPALRVLYRSSTVTMCKPYTVSSTDIVAKTAKFSLPPSSLFITHPMRLIPTNVCHDTWCNKI